MRWGGDPATAISTAEWRISVIRIAWITEMEFACSEPGPDGHFDISKPPFTEQNTPEAKKEFRKAAFVLSGNATLLSAEQAAWKAPEDAAGQFDELPISILPASHPKT